jgi:hypothetical protein
LRLIHLALATVLAVASGSCHRAPAPAVPAAASAAPLEAYPVVPARTDANAARDPWSLECGPTLVCDTRATYCEVIKTDVPELPSDHACKPLPATCRASATGGASAAGPGAAALSCDCFPAGTRCGYCVRLDRGEGFGFRRMCVGGG